MNRRVLISLFAVVVAAGLLTRHHLESRGERPAEASSPPGGATTEVVRLGSAIPQPAPVRQSVPEISGSDLQSIIGDPELAPRDRALALLKAIPRFPAALQGEACDHALLRLDDEAYQPAFEMLLAGGTTEEVRERLMADLIDRSDFLRLPYLVNLASRTAHPYSEEARMVLLTTIGDDYGTNWVGWSDAVGAHLEAASLSVPGAELLQ